MNQRLVQVDFGLLTIIEDYFRLISIVEHRSLMRFGHYLATIDFEGFQNLGLT